MKNYFLETHAKKIETMMLLAAKENKKKICVK